MIQKLSTAVASLAFVASIAQAATPADDIELEEIVVTATKTGSQTLQKTPLAIQAFTGDSLKEQNIGEIRDLIAMIPGASENSQSGVVNRSYNLRGAGGASLTNGDSPIGYYIDDVAFNIPNFGIAPPISFVDLDRVEVLRGPQGTLYGQGSAGGTFIFHTKNPDLKEFKFSGETFLSKTSGASDENYGGSAAISIPLVSDQLGLRLSGNYTKMQGFADVYDFGATGTPAKKDANFEKSNDFRAVMLWQPMSNMQVRGQYWYVHLNQGYSSLLDSVDPPYFLNTQGIDGYSRGTFKLYSLSGQLDLDTVGFNSATGYVDGSFDSVFPLGFGGSFFSGFKPKSFTTELRAHSNGSGSFHWIAGTQYQDAKGPQVNLLDITVINRFIDGSNNTETKNWAAFGEVSQDLMDGKLVPLVGLRYYKDERTYVGVAPPSDTAKLSKTTWRVNLAYLPNDAITTFVTASTGFRAGIIQSSAIAGVLQADGIPASVQNQPDSLTNYEAGLKARTQDGTLTVAASLYRTEFKNMQTSVTSSIGAGGFANLGDAHSNGVDLEARWLTPVKGLEVGAVANFNDSKFDDVNPLITPSAPAVKKGGKLAGTAAYNYRINIGYTNHLTSTMDIFGNVARSTVGSRVMVGAQEVPAYSLASATLGIRSGLWEVALVGENLANETGPTFYFTDVLQSMPRPRTVGLRFRINN